MRSLFAVVAAAVLVAAQATWPATAQSGRTPISAVVIGISVSIWPAIVADKKGFFAAEGLDLDLINAGSSARSLQQVAAGSAEIGSSSMVDLGRGDQRRRRRQDLPQQPCGRNPQPGGGKRTSGWSPRYFRGKRVMTGGRGDVTNLWWYALARHFNLDPSRDVELLFSGSTAARTAALFGGAIDATLLSTPQSFKAIDDGFTDLGPVAPYLGEFPMMIWHVNANWAHANAATLAAFIRAHNKAVRFMSEPANRRDVAEILAKASGSSVEDALKTWDLCMRINAFVADGSITEAAILRVRDTLIQNGDLKGGAVPPQAYSDQRFVDAAAR